MVKIDAQKRKLSKIGTVNVKSDKEAVTLYFRCKNQVTEHIRLSDCVLSINYKNAVEDRYMVNDLEVDGDYVTFSWLLGGNATKASGKTEFSICAEKIENGEVVKAWNTITSSFDVENSLETQTTVPEAYEDLFAELQTEIDGKLSADNVKAGDNVTVEKDGDDVVISSTGGGGEIQIDGTLQKVSGKYGVKFGAYNSETGQYDHGMPASLDGVEGALQYYHTVVGEPLINGKQDKFTVSTGLKLLNNVLSLDYAVLEQSGFFDSGKPTSGEAVNFVVQVLDRTKQNKLTAGAGISISNDVISATLGLTYEVVQTLPVAGNEQTIYLVSNSGSGSNIYDEYIWVNNAFEKIGSTDIDLSNYYNKTETNTLLNGKADAATTYTKSEVDTAVNAKISAPASASGGDFLRYRNGEWVAEAIASAESEGF